VGRQKIFFFLKKTNQNLLVEDIVVSPVATREIGRNITQNISATTELKIGRKSTNSVLSGEREILSKPELTQKLDWP